MVSHKQDGGVSKDIMQAPEGTPNESEFSHIITLADLKKQQAPITLKASLEQCSLLAIRFDLPAIHGLSATVEMQDNPIRIRGRLSAQIEQSCVATGEHIKNNIDEDIAINFIAAPKDSDEIELEDEDCETIFHNGRDIDIGEAIAQSLYLAIDPFPRSQNSDQILKQAGVISEEAMQEQQRKENPFNALSALKKP